jgi:hypothetical protein
MMHFQALERSFWATRGGFDAALFELAVVAKNGAAVALWMRIAAAMVVPRAESFMIAVWNMDGWIGCRWLWLKMREYDGRNVSIVFGGMENLGRDVEEIREWGRCLVSLRRCADLFW